MARRFHLAFPLPDGPTFVADEPGAKVAFDGSGMRITVDQFTRGYPVQTADNCKFLVLSTEDFALPGAGRISSSCHRARGVERGSAQCLIAARTRSWNCSAV
ncbi:hypothetical protein [Streptomyces brasiliscabiei]|uniref:hypothetical protein n=1 Tax=Streptomyces brasiliscabiei TaxID=2736302 RepID=UPI001C122BFD|nr:hypothetical protein [Streptomyces brasiliscabiei]